MTYQTPKVNILFFSTLSIFVLFFTTCNNLLSPKKYYEDLVKIRITGIQAVTQVYAPYYANDSVYLIPQVTAGNPAQFKVLLENKASLDCVIDLVNYNGEKVPENIATIQLDPATDTVLLQIIEIAPVETKYDFKFTITSKEFPNITNELVIKPIICTKQPETPTNITIQKNTPLKIQWNMPEPLFTDTVILHHTVSGEAFPEYIVKKPSDAENGWQKYWNSANNCYEYIFDDEFDITGEYDLKVFVLNNYSIYSIGAAIVSPQPLQNVYVDGTLTTDKGHNGTENSPLKSFARARPLMATAQNSVMHIKNTISVTNEENWEIPTGTKVQRYSTFTGNVIKIESGGNLNLKNILIDGNGVSATGELIKVEDNSKLALQDGVTIQNNKSDSGAITVHANAELALSGNVKVTGNVAANGTSAKNIVIANGANSTPVKIIGTLSGNDNELGITPQDSTVGAYLAQANGYTLQTADLKKIHQDGVATDTNGNKLRKLINNIIRIRPETNITFNTNTADEGGQGALKLIAQYDENMPAIAAINRPKKNANRFKGYFDSQSGGNKYYDKDLVSAKTWDKDIEPITLYAQWDTATVIWDGSSTTQPILEDSTYYIISADELAWIALQSNSSETFASKTVKLISDLNMTSKSFNGIATASGKTFAGIFDGNGKVVNNLSITGNAGNIGFIGENTGTIQKLGITGTISGTSSTSLNIGGLVGINKGTINQCYNAATVTGEVTSTSTSLQIGGIAGENIKDIANCYNITAITGKVNTSSGSGKAYTGGIAGYLNNMSSITNSYNFGIITSNTPNTAGGTNGEKNGTITDNFYLVDTSINNGLGGLGNSTGTGTTSKTTAEFAQQSTFTGWDFSAIWKMDTAKARPVLIGVGEAR